MKKIISLAILTTCISITTYAESTTEIKTAETKNSQQISLSTNNKADIKADLEVIQNFSASLEQHGMALQKNLMRVIQEQNTTQLPQLIAEFKTFVQENNIELQKLSLKSSEVNQLRQKIIDSNLIGLEMTETMFTANSRQSSDPKKFEQLQEKAMQAQHELMIISQDIQTKLKD